MAATEFLNDGERLLFPEPTFLLTLAAKRPGEITAPDRKLIDSSKALELFQEHNDIGSLLTDLLGRDNLLIAQTYVQMIKNGRLAYKSNVANSALFGARVVPFLDQAQAVSWPRDSFTNLNGRLLVNQRRWKFTDATVQNSSLGEGGKVLVSGNTILVSKDIWDQQKKGEITDLKQAGYTVGFLPRVDPEKQELDFNWEDNHIDGHSSLIRDKNNGLILMVAASYATQSRDTRRALNFTSEEVGAKLEIIDDTCLPGLSFNMLQFGNGHIAMTSGASALEQALKDVLGADKVHTTKSPILKIPTTGYGSIRCLTNVLPVLPSAYWEYKSKE